MNCSVASAFALGDAVRSSTHFIEHPCHRKMLLVSSVSAVAIVLASVAQDMAEVAVTRDGQPGGHRAAGVTQARRLLVQDTDRARQADVEQTLPTIKEAELSGAKVENGRLIVPEGKTKAETFILLGEGELTKSLGLSLDKVGPGGIIVRSGVNTIALLAKDDGLDNGRYPVHARAVFRLLRGMGLSLPVARGGGKVHPHKPTLTVADLNVQFTPPVGRRNIRSTATGPGGYEQGLAYLGFTNADRVVRLAPVAGAWGAVMPDGL